MNHRTYDLNIAERSTDVWPLKWRWTKRSMTQWLPIDQKMSDLKNADESHDPWPNDCRYTKRCLTPKMPMDHTVYEHKIADRPYVMNQRLPMHITSYSLKNTDKPHDSWLQDCRTTSIGMISILLTNFRRYIYEQMIADRSLYMWYQFCRWIFICMSPFANGPSLV